MATIENLSAKVNERLSHAIHGSQIALGELTLEVAPQHLHEVCYALRDGEDFEFNLLIDVCGVDYLHYGVSEWETDTATGTGFERGVETLNHAAKCLEKRENHRFGTVIHLLSLTKNHRIRIKVGLEAVHPTVPSLVRIWPVASWYEREAFDLFGIHFTGHPDLRRILTDYGFMGHPFRKDFPLIGNVEVRYDAKLKQVVYEPVSIQARVLEPKVIRHDNRYESEKK